MNRFLAAFLLTFGVLSTVCAHAGQNAVTNAPADSPAAEQRWTQLLQYVNTLPEQHRAGNINTLVNGLRYATDMEIAGVADLWDTPYEFFARGAGDCEDFSIAKYFMLLDAGVPKERVKLGFAYYAADGTAALANAPAGARNTHMVVLLYQDGNDRNPAVLDMIPQIRTLGERTDLHLVFEFGVDGTYATAADQSSISKAAIDRMLSKWHDVLGRMRAGAASEAATLARARQTRPQRPLQTSLATAPAVR